MNKEAFRDYLHINYNDNMTTGIVSKIKVAEKNFNIDMDDIVANDEKTYCFLKMLRDKYGYPLSTPASSAVRKYYQFKNGIKFYRLKRYEIIMGIQSKI